MISKKLLASVVFALAMTAGCSETKFDDWNLFAKKDSDPKKRVDELPEAPPPAINPETHIASGMMLERQGDFLGAIQQYKLALKGSPKSIDIHNRIGMAHCRAGQFADADAAFEDALALDPNSAPIKNNLGFSKMSAGRLQDAEQIFRDVLATEPGFERARMNLGISLARQQRLGDATQEFAKVVPMETAYYNVGVVCMDNGNRDLARQAFNKSLAANPTYEPSQQKLAALDSGINNDGTKPVRSAAPPPVAANGSVQMPGRVLMAGETTLDQPSP